MSKVQRGCHWIFEIVTFLMLFGLFIALFACQRTGVSYKRGFFCDDSSIRFPYKTGTVPTFALAIISVILPVVVVSTIQN